MTALLLVGAALYGLVIGSFLNVVIYRVPAGQSVVRPPSACPHCHQPIRPQDNVPVLSWLALKGRCHNCRAPISARYPLVELLTGTAFVAVALRFGWSWSLPAEILFTGGIIALAFIDFDHMRLPKVIVFITGGAVGAALLVAAGVQGSWHRLGWAALCAVVEFVVLYVINWVSPNSLGFGDVRLGPVLALALGWIGWRYAFWGFLVANFLGVVVGLALLVSRKGGLRTKVPFGVFLGAGAFLTMLYSGAIRYPG